MGIALSQEEARHARIEASSEEGSPAFVENVEEAALLLEVVAYKGKVKIGPGATPRAPAPSVEVTDPKGVPSVGPGGDASRVEDVLFRGPVAQGPKKMTRFCERESTNVQAGAEGSLSASQAVERRRGPTPGVQANLGDTSSAQDDKEIFSQSEPWALKILRDLLPVESRVIWESTALGQKPPLDPEGRGPRGVNRELNDLEERICAVDGCFAWVEYQYHVMEKHPPLVLGRHHVEDLKRPEELVLIQVAREVLRPNAPPSVWEHLEDFIKAMVVEACLEELRHEDTAGGGQRDQAKKNIVDLLEARDAALLQQDEAINNIEAVIGAKRGLELALEEANAEVASLRLAMREIEASTKRLFEQLGALQAERARMECLWSEDSQSHEKATELTVKLEASKTEVKVVELTTKLEASRAEVAQLYEQVAELRGVEGIDDS
ncbi:hypothetical protein ACLOJK_036699 [Asimina triloba]